MQDNYKRTINYLRLSVTDRCNLRCRYCMPERGIENIPRSEILHYGEMVEFLRAIVPLGLRGVRITGGEPLVRKDLERLISKLSATPGLEDISMTTNAILLRKYASSLKKAGLKRVNISLDTLKPDRFRHISRGGNLADVLDGIEAAVEVGFSPIKLNTVVIPGFNEDEIEDLAKLTLDHPWHIRYIEFMPIGGAKFQQSRGYISSPELIRRLSKNFELNPVESPPGLGPAKYWKIKGGQGTLGFISPLSQHFCDECNRLRLTADGWLRSCLFDDRLGVDIKKPLRAGASVSELQELFKLAVKRKPAGHLLDREDNRRYYQNMSQIGG